MENSGFNFNFCFFCEFQLGCGVSMTTIATRGKRKPPWLSKAFDTDF